MKQFISDSLSDILRRNLYINSQASATKILFRDPLTAWSADHFQSSIYTVNVSVEGKLSFLGDIRGEKNRQLCRRTQSVLDIVNAQT